MSKKMMFSSTTGGFYTEAVHGDLIPTDAIEISFEKYSELMDGVSKGKAISVDSDGYPVVSEYPEMTASKKEELARDLRNKILVQTSWMIDRHNEEKFNINKTTLSDEEFSELIKYRQELRDWPEKKGWPDIEMPPKPEWLI